MHFEKSNDASTHNIARMSEVDNQRKWDVEVQAECMHVFVRDCQILWELCSVALSRVPGFLELERHSGPELCAVSAGASQSGLLSEVLTVLSVSSVAPVSCLYNQTCYSLSLLTWRESGANCI